MKRKIAVITGTRAEYGLFKIILNKIIQSQKLELKLIVTGTHLSPQHGNTYQQILKDGFKIDYKVDLLVGGDSPSAVAKSIGLGTISFAQVFAEFKPDILLFLGDRYELLAAASAALPFNIILAHIAGGEITEGAMDDQIRHALTKLSHLHFACAEPYKNNIKKLAEEDWRIFDVGHPCLELIKETNLISEEELFKTYNLDTEKLLFLVTLHTTTLNTIEEEIRQTMAFFETLREYPDVNILITYPNADTNSHVIVEEIEKIKTMKNISVFHNMGSTIYLSFMQIADLVIGNSSSGLVEGPYFKIPVVNYGDRQKGRLQASNIVDSAPNKEELKKSIDFALNNADFRKSLPATKSTYGLGNTSDSIIKVLEEIEISEITLKKKFVV